MLRRTAHAKFDLAIHIESKKKTDGYYPVYYIDCQLDLSDKLTFENQRDDIEIVCDEPTLRDTEENFVYKSAILLKKIVGDRRLGARITLIKNIPIKAGFGGGSSDAAATILGLSRLWKVTLSAIQKRHLARLLGKDFYYSLYGGLSEVIGDGKNYTVNAFSTHLPRFWLLVVVPREQKPSTAWVYENLKTRDVGRNFGKFEKLKTAILKNDKIGILKNLTNDFEILTSSKFSIVDDLKASLTGVGAKAVIMAGSGLSVVGFFENRAKAQKAKGKLRGKYQKVLIAKIIN